MKPQNYPDHPAHLWSHFYEISQIPRPSGEEARVRSYLTDLADAGGHSWQVDAAGNLLVQVAAAPGMEGRDSVLIQNHLDMVTVKRSDKEHDFSHDPLTLVVENGWLRADATTLGADNGVGCAAAAALMTDPEIAHPALELLFTVDEETGLHGALALDATMLTASRMLNLDTEDWNELYVGCAGGAGWEFTREFDVQPAQAESEFWQLGLEGLAGGHSGIQIHEQLGNAIKILAQCVQGLAGVRLAHADIGVAHNVIPREGIMTFACDAGLGEQLQDRLGQLRTEFLGYLPSSDAQLEFTLVPAEPTPTLGAEDSCMVLDIIAAFPHGALAYNPQSPADLVDLSINLAILRLGAGELFVESSYRFFNEAQSEPLQSTVKALARAYGLTMSPVVGYPGWQPDFESALLGEAKALHLEMFEFVPEVKAIHAGLECGIVKGKKADLDILSFGPTIRGAHSPQERLQIDTVEPFWRFLTSLLARM
jgi:dipeptidase D